MGRQGKLDGGLLFVVFFLVTITMSSHCYQGDYYSEVNKGDVSLDSVGCSLSYGSTSDKSKKLLVEKQKDILYVYIPLDSIIGNYICYPLKHRSICFSENKYPSFLDNWGIMQPFSATVSNGVSNIIDVLFNEGESELAISVPSGENEKRYVYVGGYAHGFEVIVNNNDGRSFKIFVDDTEIKEDTSFNMKTCDLVNVVQETELYQAYTNTNPWSLVMKNWKFTQEGVSIMTRMTMLRELSLNNSFFGMFCVYRHVNGDKTRPYLTSRAIKDTDSLIVYCTEDGWDDLPENKKLRKKDKDCRKIIQYGETDYKFSIQIADATMKEDGGMSMGTNNLSYNKVYFDLTGIYQPKTGEVLQATQLWSISKANHAPNDTATTR